MKCKKCGTEFEGKFCPECETAAGPITPISQPLSPPNVGRQQPITKNNKSSKKKPFFKKRWFIILVIIVVIAVIISLNGEEKGGDKIKWINMELGNMLPDPPSNKGRIYNNSNEELWCSLEKVSDKQYDDYYNACVERGFNIDGDKTTFSYKAYNSEGYCLDISHVSDDLEIHLTVPRSFSDIKWPTSTAGKMLPAPKSMIGEFSYEYDNSFYIEIGNTSKEDYDEYVNACSEKGFTVDYNKGDDYYYANNVEGWRLSLNYEGNNIMAINISAPDTELESTEARSLEPKSIEAESTEAGGPELESTEAGSIKLETTEPEGATVGEAQEDGLSSDFKEAMDSYEAFIDEYVAFMKKYNDNPTDIGLLVDYADYMGKYAKSMDDFEKWDDSEMNAAETAYYIDVQARVSKKLLEIAAELETTEAESIKSEITEPESTTLEETKEDGLSSDFKEAMDSYEAFIDEYIDFMKKYKDNPSDIGLLVEYADYMGKYAKFVRDFEKWEDLEMNVEETAYYIDVQARVSKKLLEVTQ